MFTSFYEGRTAFSPSALLPRRHPSVDLKRLREAARNKGIPVGAICHIFYDADTLQTRKDLVPLDQHGHGTFVNWQKLLCPSDRAYQDDKLAILEEIARTVGPDIMSLDFVRFPTTWELIPPGARAANLRNFCFWDRCLEAFQASARVRLPAGLGTAARRPAGSWRTTERRGNAGRRTPSRISWPGLHAGCGRPPRDPRERARGALA